MVRSPLPDDPSRITPEWLEAALGEELPEVRVASVEVLGVRHGTNSNARLGVSYREPCGLPGSFFLKLPPLDPERRRSIIATGMGRREALFYRTLARHVPMRVPRPYLALYREASGAFVLLLEDLEPTAAKLPDPVAGLGVAHAQRAMDDFAALHVRYEDEGVREREAAWVEPMPRGTDFGPSMLQYGLDHHRERLTDAFAELAALYIECQPAFEEAWERGGSTVLQGDSHVGNLFLDGDRPGFLDWGLVQLGPALRDVGYFLCMALSPETRRRNERSLLVRYLEARAQRGGRTIAFDEAWLLYRVHAAYCVPAACPLVLFPERQTEEHQRFSDSFLRRAECAIEDLEAGAAMRAYAGI